MSNPLSILSLGQVGYLFKYKTLKWVIDPYLSNYVEDKYGKLFERAIDIPIRPEELKDLDFILITHEHEDHCDPLTIRELLVANPNCVLYAPQSCNHILDEIEGTIVTNLKIGDVVTYENLEITAMPAAHTSLEIEDGYSRWMGYQMKLNDFTMYHAGDTIPFHQITDYLKPKVDLAFLPINERNYFRDKSGIVGNMTCREALSWVETLGISKWIPTHWDVFKNNGTLKAELDLLAIHSDKSNYYWLDAGNELIIEIT